MRKLPRQGDTSKGERLADFKLRAVADDFGLVGRTQRPFRLSGDRKDVAGYHEELGYRLDHMEQSSDLTARLLTGLAKSGLPCSPKTVSFDLSWHHIDVAMAQGGAAITSFRAIRGGNKPISPHSFAALRTLRAGPFVWLSHW